MLVYRASKLLQNCIITKILIIVDETLDRKTVGWVITLLHGQLVAHLKPPKVKHLPLS
jgi:hypothetical protein